MLKLWLVADAVLLHCGTTIGELLKGNSMQRFVRRAAFGILAMLFGSASALASGAGGYHILPTRSYEAKTARIPPRGQPRGSYSGESGPTDG